MGNHASPKQLTLLYNANLITLDEGQPRATACVILGEHILEVGQDQELLDKYRSTPFKTECIDINGKTILPGLIDAHLHLQQFSLSIQKVNCETATMEECIQRVAERAKKTQPGEWVLGHGWNQNNWQEGYGNATLLDQVAPLNPVFLTAKSLHAAWVNSLALERAGIDKDTPNPTGGIIQRHSDGKPTGILFENAMQLVSQVIPQPTVAQLKQAILEAQETLLQLGITCIHDFDGQECFSALQELHCEGLLKLRVVKNLPAELMDEVIGLGLRSGFGNDYLRLGSLKFFADGALGPRTAAMFEPYLGEPENRGTLLLDSETLTEQGKIAIRNGWSLAVHAIGDRANHEVLKAFQNLRRIEQERISPQYPPLRHRIEHVQVLHPQDLDRLARLKLIASMQPIHATSDMEMAERYWGKDRNRYAYAWRTQINRGTVLAFGSDAPVEYPNPFWGLHAAITRQRADGTPALEGWIPEEKLSLLDALHAYTVGAAFASVMENRTGKIKPTYYADLIVLDQDPFHIPPEQLKDLSPAMTMVGGQWRYLEKSG
ncbi:MAG: amidohydrolase [Anaerolineales bacterium]|nr:amidohydrolase [Anaerolineales bacterium]